MFNIIRLSLQFIYSGKELAGKCETIQQLVPEWLNFSVRIHFIIF